MKRIRLLLFLLGYRCAGRHQRYFFVCAIRYSAEYKTNDLIVRDFGSGASGFGTPTEKGILAVDLMQPAQSASSLVA